MLSPAAEQILRDFDRSRPRTSPPPPIDFPTAIRMFIRLIAHGDQPYPDDVQDWAIVHGWSEDDAGDLGQVAGIVALTMRELGYGAAIPPASLDGSGSNPTTDIGERSVAASREP